MVHASSYTSNWLPEKDLDSGGKYTSGLKTYIPDSKVHISRLHYATFSFIFPLHFICENVALSFSFLIIPL